MPGLQWDRDDASGDRVSADLGGFPATFAAFKANETRVRAFADRMLHLHRCGDAHAVDDLLQEVMLSLWRYRHNARDAEPIRMVMHEVRCQAYRLGHLEKHRDRTMNEHYQRVVTGMAYVLPLSNRNETRPGRRPVSAPLNSAIPIGPRTMPELDEVLVTPPLRAFLHAARPVLKPRELAALALRYAAGYPVVEIARRMGSSTGAVDGLLFRSRQQLRQRPELARLLQDAA